MKYTACSYRTQLANVILRALWYVTGGTNRCFFLCVCVSEAKVAPFQVDLPVEYRTVTSADGVFTPRRFIAQI